MICIILLFCLAIYWRTIKFGLIVDDDRLYQQHANHHRTVNWKSHHSIIHELKTRLYGGGTFGDNMAIDHSVSIALHATACVLVYLAFGRDVVAFTAAMLYACNPANNQTSIWLNGRRYQVVVILTLAMIWAGPWGIPLYFMAMSMQVTAFFAPIALGWWGIPVILAAGWAGRAKIAKFFKERIDGIVNEDQRKFTPKRLIVVVKTYAFLILKMIAPGRTLMIYPFLLQWGLNEQGNRKAYAFDWRFWTGCALLAGSAATPFFLHGRDVWLFVFMVMATLQCCNWMIANQNVADRYVSLPNIVMMYFLSKAAIVTLAPYHLDGVALAAIATYYLVNLATTMRMYKDLEAYYDYHTFFAPESPIPRRDLVYRYLNANDPIGAWPIIKQGIRHNPNDFTTLCLAARCLQLMGDAKNSELYIAMAEQNQYINQKQFHEKDIAMMHEVNRKMLKK